MTIILLRVLGALALVLFVGVCVASVWCDDRDAL